MWHDRIRVAAEVCSGLGFLHLTKPRPIVHGHLTLSNILLDRTLVAKISGFGLTKTHNDHDVGSDIRAFGVLLLHLLTGRNWTGLVEAMSMDQAAVVRDLDEMAGEWPLDLAGRVASLALRCLSSNRGPDSDFKMEGVMGELNELKKEADEVMSLAREECKSAGDKGEDREVSKDVPRFLLCPISQVVFVLKDVPNFCVCVCVF